MTTNLELEKTLWTAADKLRSNMDAAEYKHVVLGLIFLKYISEFPDFKFCAVWTLLVMGTAVANITLDKENRLGSQI